MVRPILKDPFLTDTVTSHELPFLLVLELFLEKLFSGMCVPTYLRNGLHLLKYIQEIFHEYSNSMVSIAKELKSELRRYFSMPCEITEKPIRSYDSYILRR